jgi:hypothetical protein
MFSHRIAFMNSNIPILLAWMLRRNIVIEEASILFGSADMIV